MLLNIKKRILTKQFIEKYTTQKPNFGFNGLGEFVYKRTYARKINDEGKLEEWYQTVQRVIEGTFDMQRKWYKQNRLPWNTKQERKVAEKMYEKIYTMKFLPPGRGLWAMGADVIVKKRLHAALNNCAFISTEDVDPNDPAKPFAFLMDASMLGVGVGFDTKGAGKIFVKGIKHSAKSVTFIVQDTREGWVNAVRRCINGYILGWPLVIYNTSLIRKAGTDIKTFGGKAGGPELLNELLFDISVIMNERTGKILRVRDIVDIMNLIGKCVVSGNVRRTAEIAFGNIDDEEYLSLKDYSVNPERRTYGWTSNNSVFADVGSDYTKIVERIYDNGEPGICWLDNMQRYGRMRDPPNMKDRRVTGGNPCLEQSLESGELCCLVETFPDKHKDLEEFEDTLFYALLYAKIVTLGTTHWEQSNKIIARNRRVGCSMSGITQFIGNRSIHELRAWCFLGYNRLKQYDVEISEKLGIPQSVKITSVKPSGTVSLLAGATAGVHFPESRFYIRRVRLSANSELLPALKKANYYITQAYLQPDTVIVEIPVDMGENIKTLKDVSIWEQLKLTSLMQKWWADNQVSSTVTFDPEKTTEEELKTAIEYFEEDLKGISFLPRVKEGAYPQMPYEAISEEEYKQKIKFLNKDIEYDEIYKKGIEENIELYCDNDSCKY